MSIKIGDNNRIKNSVISDRSTINANAEKSSWFQRHPFITGIIASVVAGLILTLSFWEKIVNTLCKLFGG